jgi:uncharacterized membrane protein YagU involved in acid resistance
LNAAWNIDSFFIFVIIYLSRKEDKKLKYEKWKGRTDLIKTKKQQLINKKMFHWGIIATSLVTLLSLACGLVYSDFVRGFGSGLIIWLLLTVFIARLLDQKRISLSFLMGFLIGEVIIVMPMLSIYLILATLVKEEFVAEVFGFLISLVSFSIANIILATRIHKTERELFELQLAQKGAKTIEELQKNPKLHL